MADSIHIWIAAFVFAMLLLGVILTIVEFRRTIRESDEPTSDRPAGNPHGPATEQRHSGSRDSG